MAVKLVINYDGFAIWTGDVAPINNLSANPGDLYLRDDGVNSGVFQHQGVAGNDQDWIDISAPPGQGGDFFADGSVPMSADIDIGANDVVNVGLVDGRDVSVDGTRLDGIETAATADQSDSEIKTAYENNADTNAFTDAEQTKLTNIETAATADQSDAEIETAYNAQVGVVSQVDAEAGISTTVERWTPERVKQAVTVLSNAPTFTAVAVGTYTVLITDEILLVSVDSVITLPAAATFGSRILDIKLVESVEVSVQTSGGDTIDGSASALLQTRWNNITLACDGTASFYIL